MAHGRACRSTDLRESLGEVAEVGPPSRTRDVRAVAFVLDSQQEKSQWAVILCRKPQRTRACLRPDLFFPHQQFGFHFAEAANHAVRMLSALMCQMQSLLHSGARSRTGEKRGVAGRTADRVR